MRRRALLSGGNIDYSQKYFTMVVTVGGDITWTGSITNNTLSYSKDNGKTWTTANSGTSISVAAGDKVLWKGTPTPQSSKGIGRFSGTTNTRYSVEGNAMSLLFGDNFKGQTSLNGKDCALYYLFYNNTNITSAENLSLPATTLATQCYLGMFRHCSRLTTAPSLPATIAKSYCYSQMFDGCSSLTTAPELPATWLESGCYSQMFSGCVSLTTAPVLRTRSLDNDCYYKMFTYCRNLNSITCFATYIGASNCTRDWVYGVAASGTFTKAASMTSWTTGTSGIPEGWTVVNA